MMSSVNFVRVLIVLNFVLYISSEAIERVDDTDLVHLLTGEDNVVALFTKPNCDECDNLESLVENIQSDLKDSLGAAVVKVESSHLVSVYDPSREPSLIYFRRGIPLLYYGELSEEEIVRTFNDNKDPVVKELSDENFEHLTQAATGATTGDWFVFFYSADCVFCQRLYAVWEAVGAKLKQRLNVARVNRLEAGISTANRFKIAESPTFILLRQGKFYRYKSKEYTPKSFIEFVEHGYRKQSHPETVPAVSSPMNEFLASQLEVFAANSQLLILLSIITALVFIAIYAFKSMSRRKVQPSEKKAK